MFARSSRRERSRLSGQDGISDLIYYADFQVKKSRIKNVLGYLWLFSQITN